jgi:hypothetical protein
MQIQNFPHIYVNIKIIKILIIKLFFFRYLTIGHTKCQNYKKIAVWYLTNVKLPISKPFVFPYLSILSENINYFFKSHICFIFLRKKRLAHTAHDFIKYSYHFVVAY